MGRCYDGSAGAKAAPLLKKCMKERKPGCWRKVKKCMKERKPGCWRKGSSITRRACTLSHGMHLLVSKLFDLALVCYRGAREGKVRGYDQLTRRYGEYLNK